MPGREQAEDRVSYRSYRYKAAGICEDLRGDELCLFATFFCCRRVYLRPVPHLIRWCPLPSPGGKDYIMNQITITADNITIEACIGGAEQQAPKKKEMPKSAIYIERYDDARRIINLGNQYIWRTSRTAPKA